VLHGGATAYGLMTAAQGVGAIGGGLAVAALRRTGPKLLVVQAIAFGSAMTLLTFSPNLPTAIGFMVVVGFTATSFSATGNTTVQLNTDPRMRGRVMSLWVLATQGSTPIGGPLTGFVASTVGAREALGLGAASCFAAAGLGAFVAGRRGSRRTDAAPVALTVPAEPDSA